MTSNNTAEEDPTADMQTPLISNEVSEEISPLPPPANEIGDEEEQQNLTVRVQGEVTPDERQEYQCRDAPFAILFLAHLAVILYFTFAWGLPAAIAGTKDADESYNHDDDFEDVEFSGMLALLAVSSAAGMVALVAALSFMIQFASHLVQISLISSIVMSLMFAVAFLLKGFLFLSILYFLSFAIATCYSIAVWRRIPFSAANLSTALTAVKSNIGITILAFGMMLVLVIWSVLWTLSYYGIYMHATQGCTDDQCREDKNPLAGIVGFMFLLSFYWTSEVIKNILHVTTAGVVATFWHVPEEANSCCSPAISDSLKRSMVTSFGSICFGSLLMAIVRVLRYLVHQARRSNNRNTLLLCVLECLVACLENVIEYTTKWAYIYVALYGCDFLESGRRCFQLFRDRGWTMIINDNLVYRVLILMSIVVGGLTGCIGMLIASSTSWVDDFEDSKYILAFWLPFIVGLAMANIVFGVVASATDTVIVCFAESPNDFERNYPELSRNMLSAWNQIYPSEFGM